MDQRDRRAASREHEIDRLDDSLTELERLGAPRPIWAGLRGHADAVLDDWRASLEIYSQREFTEGV